MKLKKGGMEIKREAIELYRYAITQRVSSHIILYLISFIGFDNLTFIFDMQKTTVCLLAQSLHSASINCITMYVGRYCSTRGCIWTSACGAIHHRNVISSKN